MLLGRPGTERPPEAPVVGLQTLTLTQRIISQRHESFEREVDRDTLHRRLTFVPVTERQQYSGIFPRLAGPV